MVASVPRLAEVRWLAAGPTAVEREDGAYILNWSNEGTERTFMLVRKSDHKIIVVAYRVPRMEQQDLVAGLKRLVA